MKYLFYAKLISFVVMVTYINDIRQFSVSGICPDIRQSNPGSANTGYQKRPDYPAGYLVNPY
jgi:hypothetical protein